MKILQVVQDFPPYNMAGVELYTYYISRQLAKEHEVFIFHRKNDLSKEEYKVENRNDNGLNIYTINNTFKNCYSFQYLYQNHTIDKKFRKILNHINPDIVHIQHLIFLSLGLIKEIRKKRIPIVYTLHDYWLICPQWHFLDHNWEVCEKENYLKCIECLKSQLYIKKTPKKFYNIFRSLLPRRVRLVCEKIYFSVTKLFHSTTRCIEELEKREKNVKDSIEKINFFIAPSKFIKKKYIDFGIPKEKIQYCDYGISFSLRNKHFAKEKAKSTNFRFGFVGTILPAKGLHILIKAFSKLENETITLNIFGKLRSYRGFEKYPDYIKQLANDERVKFKGRFPNENVSTVFSKLEALVVPSIWYENSPFVIHEAFLFNTPVIASDIGGIPELVQHYKNGLLFKPGNIKDLSKKMELLTDKSVYENLKEKISPPKDIQKNVREIEQIYKIV